MQESYPIRTCPTPGCGRFLMYWKEEFACWSCWKKYKLGETLPHSSPEGICRFVKRVAEVGAYFICINCGKTIFLTNEELSAYEDRMDTFFSNEHIEKERKSSEEWIQKFEKNIQITDLIDKQSSITKESIKDLLKRWKPGDTLVFVDSEGKEI